MSSAANKYTNRSFRYVLRPHDEADMRFSLQSTKGAAGIERTQLIDLSETGVSFFLGSQTDLVINERIKVEVPIPEGGQIAWWGRVVRMDHVDPNGWPWTPGAFADEPHIKVAVKFDKLPEAHSRSIRRGIERAFMRAMREQQYRNWLYYRALAMQYVWQAAAIFVLTAFVIGFLYYFMLPSDNYDPAKGTPWGERFKLFDSK